MAYTSFCRFFGEEGRLFGEGNCPADPREDLAFAIGEYTLPYFNPADGPEPDGNDVEW